MTAPTAGRQCIATTPQCCSGWLSKQPTGTVVHAIGEEGVATRDIAEAIGRHLAVPVTSVAPENAIEHFGWIGAFFALDIPASSAITRQRFGWQPTGIGLLEDLDQGHYF